MKRCLRTGRESPTEFDRPPQLAQHCDRITELYARCQKNLVRVHEELAADGVVVAYTTLTRFCRRLGLGTPPKEPAGRYTFTAGEEMQHDTSPHDVELGGKKRRVQTAAVVLCFSRMRFIQAYPTFNRFYCKAFLTEALKYFGGACGRCEIDNTHVVVSSGTGKKMVPAPEMAAFAERFNFKFEAHELGDANRSAHVERGFDFVERNFLAGRKFQDWTDLNAQARAWCDKVNHKRSDKLKTRPIDLFATEQLHLRPLPAYVPEVYQLHERLVDVEGYVSVHANHYSAPYALIGRRVQIHEFIDRLEIFDGRKRVATHTRLWDGSGARVTTAEHRPQRGERQAHQHPDHAAMQRFPDVAKTFVAAVEKRRPHRVVPTIRALARMLAEYPPGPVHAALAEAMQYGLHDVERLESMVLRRIADDFFPK